MSELLKLYPGDAFFLFTANVLLQVIVVILLAWLLTKIVFRHNAAIRHNIWLSALLFVLVSPMLICFSDYVGLKIVSIRLPKTRQMVTNIIKESPNIENNVRASIDVVKPSTSPSRELIYNALSTDGDYHADKGIMQKHDEQSIQKKSEREHVAVTATGGPDARTSGDLSVSFGFVDRLRATGVVFLIGWALGVLYLFAQLIRRGYAMRELIQKALDIGDNHEINQVFASIRRIVGIHRLPRVLTWGDDKINITPITAGVIRPVVILSQTLLKTLNREELCNILLHEFAHVWRHDPMIGFLQRVVEITFWPYLPVWLMNRNLARAREEVCDNYVLLHTDGPKYAQTLFDISQQINPISPTLAQVGLFQYRWSLEQRVAGLLDSRRNVMTRINRITFGVFVASLLVFGIFIAGTKLLQAEPPIVKENENNKNASNDSDANVQRRIVYKMVKDFPLKVDLSMPESLVAEVIRLSALKGSQFMRMSELLKTDSEHINYIESTYKIIPEYSKDLRKMVADTQIIEVLTYKDDWAGVIIKSDLEKRQVYGLDYLVRENGIWKGHHIAYGYSSIEYARKAFELDKDKLSREMELNDGHAIADSVKTKKNDPDIDLTFLNRKEDNVTAKLQRSVVKKYVNDFPDKPNGYDLSTPESAWAAYQRAAAEKDIKTLINLTDYRDVKPLIQELQQFFNDKNIDSYCQAVMDSEIIEVAVYRDDFVQVISKLKFKEGEGSDPYSARSFGRIGDSWKNLGEYRLPSLEAARANFENKKENLYCDFLEVKDIVTGKKKPSADMKVLPEVYPRVKAITQDDSSAKVQRRAVNKLVKDFPEKVDLSMPESAVVMLGRGLAQKDITAAFEWSWVKMDTQVVKDMEDGLKHDPNAPKDEDFKQMYYNAEIIDVLTYRDDLAAVIYKVIDGHSPPYGAAILGKINGVWKVILFKDLDKDLKFTSVKEVAERFDSVKDDYWQRFVKMRNEVLNGRTPMFEFPTSGDFKYKNKTNEKTVTPSNKTGQSQSPLVSDAEKEKVKKETWQIRLDLNMPSLNPQAVQYAILDKDPVPDFIVQIKSMMNGFNLQQHANDEATKEQLRRLQMTMAWDLGFKKVTGDELCLLTKQPGMNFSGHSTLSNGPAGTKWIVTKTVHIEGKPVCWCIPVQVKTGSEATVTFNESNTFDLKTIFDKTIQESADATPQSSKAETKASNVQNLAEKYPELKKRSTEEIIVLKQLVEKKEQIFKNVEVLFKQGAKGGEGENYALAKLNYELAKTELAWAEGRIEDAYLYTLQAAQSAKDYNLAISARYDLGISSLEVLDESENRLAKTKLQLIRAEEIAKAAGVDVDAIKKRQEKSVFNPEGK